MHDLLGIEVKGFGSSLKGALQLLINRHGYIRFVQVPERVSTRSFVVLIYRKLEVESLRRAGRPQPQPLVGTVVIGLGCFTPAWLLV